MQKPLSLHALDKLLSLAYLLLAFAAFAAVANAQPKVGFAPEGETLKYDRPNFTHFDYVNPQAPKGGALVLSTSGTFDSFNTMTIKGHSAAGLGNIYETLMTSAADEKSSQYGLLAETIEVAADKKSVTYVLRKEAKWHDGSPVEVEDVIWTYKTATGENGLPTMRNYLADIKDIKKTGARAVTFYFVDDKNRELAQIIGNALSILPRSVWENKDITKPFLGEVMGSGPYRVGEYKTGSFVTYDRVKNYWGKDLPINKGRNNFDTIRYDYYRDRSVEREAVKAGNIDVFYENNSKEWSTGYDIEQVKSGKIKKILFPRQLTQGMQGWVFNQRRAIFQDPVLREAITYALDFEWTNKTLFYGLYKRSRSYFGLSDMEAKGLPSSDELKLLNPLKGQIPGRVFLEEYNPPSTAGSERGLRNNLKKALDLLKKGGYVINPDGKLIEPKNKTQVSFTMLQYDESFDRISLPFVRNLARLGIEAEVQRVDVSQYVDRLRKFDYDMVSHVFGQSLSPGNEQLYFWGSQAAEENGSQNLSGVKSPAIDALIQHIIVAPNRKSLVTAVKALDRVLQWNFLVVPHYHGDNYFFLVKDKVGMPEIVPLYGPQTDAWWSKKL